MSLTSGLSAYQIGAAEEEGKTAMEMRALEMKNDSAIDQLNMIICSMNAFNDRFNKRMDSLDADIKKLIKRIDDDNR